MNLEDNIKEHIIKQIALGNLALNLEKVDQFVEFVIDFLTSETSFSDLYIRVTSLSKSEWDTIVEKFDSENTFNDLLYKSFKLEKRKALKDKFSKWSQEQAEKDWENLFEKAFLLERRSELKEKLKNLEKNIKHNQKFNGSEPAEILPRIGKISANDQKRISFLKPLSIAASIILILIVWQPQHWSDKKIFEKYSVELDSNLLLDVSEVTGKTTNDNIRGDEYYFEGYTQSESNLLLEAINLVKNKQFLLAKEIFDKVGVKKDGNIGLNLYFSIALLNSGHYNEAVINLKYLKKVSNAQVYDDIDYYLALAYLKAGEREKAKTFLNSIVKNQENKYQEQAKAILKKFRWF